MAKQNKTSPDQAGKNEATRHQLPMQVRMAALQSFDEKARTVELVWTTGATVRRQRWIDFDTYETYDETLSLDPAHVDLARLNGGAPLLNTHGSWDLSDVLGVVEKAWIDEATGEGRALVRFSEREDVAPVVQDVKAGIIRNVSVGYAVRKFEITRTQGEIAKWLAVDWEPYELSLVPIGADAGAGTRAADQKTFPCSFVNRAPAAHIEERANMDDDKPAGAETAPEKNAAQTEAARAEATRLERARVQEIDKICKQAAIADDQRAKFVADGVSVDEVRKAALDAVATRSEQQGQQRAAIAVGVEEVEKRAAALQTALLHRYQPTAFKLDDTAREFRGLTLLEMARDHLQAQGMRVRGLSRMELAGLALGLTRSGGMQSTSDFANILANVANKTLRQGYESAPQTFKPWTRAATAADFKQVSRTQLGDAPNLLKVAESGEIKRGTFGDGAEKYSLATYARTAAITRQALINDDMDAFSRLPMSFGRSAADLESDVVWAIVTANEAMADGIALFHADHGNLVTGAAIAIASLGVARNAMRQQKNLQSRFINVTPKYLLVPTALETLAQQFCTATNIIYSKGSDTNPFAGVTTPIAEPRLDAASTSNWYMAADPAQIDTIEYAHLEGQEGVYLEQRVGFDVDGLELKARLDFAAKAIDHRGLVKNPN